MIGNFYLRHQSIVRVVDVREFCGERWAVVEVIAYLVDDHAYRHARVDTVRVSELQESVPEPEAWREQVVKLTKRANAEREVAQYKREAETYGVRVAGARLREAWSTPTRSEEIIVSCTAARWKRIDGKEYHRDTGKMVGRGTHSYLPPESVASLEALAGGRKKVDFVKERMSAGVKID